MNKPYKVASLFCGCGGSDLGMVGGFSYLGKEYPKLDFEIVYAIDFDKNAVETYNRNFRHAARCIDVKDADFSTIGNIDILIGGFPCQSFSTVNPTKDTNDDRANLYKQIVRFLKEKRPKFFVCENVKGLLTLQGGAIIQKIVGEFRSVGYNVTYRLVKAVEYGVPQRRERVIIVGIRQDIDATFRFPVSTISNGKYTPLKAVIDELAIENKKYYFSEKAVQGMRNAKNNMKRGLWQNLDEPCLTITSHLAKTSINSRDPVLLVDPEKDIYRRFTPREAAKIQSFPDSFIFPGSESAAYRQIGNAVPPVMMWYIAKSLMVCIDGCHPEYIEDEPEHFKPVIIYNPIQLALFDSGSIYYSMYKSCLIGTCRQGNRQWIQEHMMYNYPVTDTDIEEHPYLLDVKHLLIKFRKSVLGYYDILNARIVDKSELEVLGYPSRSSHNKVGMKYVLYEINESDDTQPIIETEDCILIKGKGVKE